MERKLGVVTIGQSPRPDMLAEIQALWGAGITIVESGVLDNLSREQIKAMAPSGGEEMLVTRLRDGTSVQVAHKPVARHLEACIAEMFESGIPVVLVLCSGRFDAPPGNGLLILPQPVLYQLSCALAAGKCLGVLCPADAQIPQMKDQWMGAGLRQVVRAASPYGQADALVVAAREMRAAGVELVVMDCMGYSRSMQKIVCETAGVPVLLARTVIARVILDLMG